MITIAICALAVVGGVLWLSHYQHESGMRPLYSSLSPEDASAIVQKLRETGVDYKVSDNGAAVLVAESRVPELRLQMAGLGLPKTGRIGFEIFDKTNFGMTDFAEHVNYRRAVEGELERSVRALAEVDRARVHVTLPKESVFSESREAAKASVLVGLRPGRQLSAQNVLAIRNLVSSAVEGLTPEAVSVVDMNGNLLSQPRRNSLDEGVQVTEAALEYRQAVERDLAVKINNTLEPLLGADKFRTGVSADVDMTSGEQSEETFDPSKSVMLTSQKSEDTNGSTRPGPIPSPGTAANLPTMTTASITAPAITQPAAATATPGTAAGSTPAAASGAATDPPKPAATAAHWNHHQLEQAHGKHHLPIQPDREAREDAARDHQEVVDRRAGGSRDQAGGPGQAGASGGPAARYRKAESDSKPGWCAGWVQYRARRSAHGRGAAV